MVSIYRKEGEIFCMEKERREEEGKKRGEEGRRTRSASSMKRKEEEEGRGRHSLLFRRKRRNIMDLEGEEETFYIYMNMTSENKRSVCPYAEVVHPFRLVSPLQRLPHLI